ncbi:unnamed protein product [Effrenium voratum]|uniref:Kinesin motor domain-containing protein n=1 Tax=Effrenium voratum TaxID=2562239 RepID=A0AA36JHU4_9DINO|nr:unnamed protein product [Effrenium voratum]
MRAVARTNMNAASSRSHGMATFQIEQLIPGRDDMRRRRAQLQTVDLAGAARMDQIGDSEARQRESRLINTSLLTLGLVIKRLSAQDHSSPRSRGHIPCRDNKLTHLLSDSLLGNCRTVVVTCVSPASSAVASTESALRFAANCRKVFTHPTRNEEPKNEMAMALRRELDQLNRELNSSQSAEVRRELSDRVTTAQLLAELYGSSWEEQEARSRELEFERRQLLTSLGLAPGAGAKGKPVSARGVQTSRGRFSGGSASMSRESLSRSHEEEPCIVNICDDPLLSGCLRYSLPGNHPVYIGSSASCQIHVEGLGITPEMCSLVWRPGREVELQVSDNAAGSWERPTRQGALFKQGAGKVLVNGRQIQEFGVLQHGDVLQVGHGHMFQLLGPPNVRMSSKPERPAVNLPTGFVEDLEAEFGDTAAAVVAAVQELQPLLEEATDITRELRGEQMVFHAEVLHRGLTDGASDRPDEPEIVVALREGPGAELDHSEATLQGLAAPLVTVWSVDKFKDKLEALRDLYHEISERGTPWTEADANPWEDTPASPNRMDKGTESDALQDAESPSRALSLRRLEEHFEAPLPGESTLAALPQDMAQEPVVQLPLADVCQDQGTMTPSFSPQSTARNAPTEPVGSPRGKATLTEPVGSPSGNATLTEPVGSPQRSAAVTEPVISPRTNMARLPPAEPGTQPSGMFRPQLMTLPTRTVLPMGAALPMGALPSGFVTRHSEPIGPVTPPGAACARPLTPPRGTAARAALAMPGAPAPATEPVGTGKMQSADLEATLKGPAAAAAAAFLKSGQEDDTRPRTPPRNVRPWNCMPHGDDPLATEEPTPKPHAGASTAKPQLHRAMRGMPDVAGRRSPQRWAMKQENLPHVLKDLALQLSETRRGIQDSREKVPGKEARPASTDSKDRGLSIAKRQGPAQDAKPKMSLAVPKAESHKEAPKQWTPRKRAEGRPDRGRPSSADRKRTPTKAERRSRSETDRNEDNPVADLFEIPEQLREAKRRTSELEMQLAELRQRLQQQENRTLASAPAPTPAPFVTAAGLVTPPAWTARPAPLAPREVHLASHVAPAFATQPELKPKAYSRMQTPPVEFLSRDHRASSPPMGARSCSPQFRQLSPCPVHRWVAPPLPAAAHAGGQVYAAPVSYRLASPSPMTRTYVASPPRAGVSPMRYAAPFAAPAAGLPASTSFWVHAPIAPPPAQLPWLRDFRAGQSPSSAKEPPDSAPGALTEPVQALTR